MKPLELPGVERIDFKNKAAWLKLRQTGIFGSDVPAILGYDKFRSAIDIFMEKKGMKPSFEGNTITEFGKHCQDFVLSAYQKEKGYTGIHEPGLYFSKRIRYLGGNPDWIASPVQTHGAECKVRGFRALQDYKDGRCPMSDVLQSCLYMSVFNMDRWDVVAFVGEAVLRIIPLERDKGVEDWMLTKIDKFWNNLQRDIPPPDDGSKSYEQFVTRKHFKHGEDERAATEEEGELIKELHDVYTQQAELAKTISIKENELKQKMGSAYRLLSDYGNVTWSRFEKNSTSWKAVASALKASPELIDKFSSTTKENRFSIKTSGADEAEE
jgi:predicted phage-related endonuclease